MEMISSLGIQKFSSLNEFGEKIALAASTPQERGSIIIKGLLTRLSSSGDETKYLMTLSCCAKVHPLHSERRAERFEIHDMATGSKEDNYEDFHPAMRSYFDRLMQSIKDYSSDFYEMLLVKETKVDERNFTFEISLPERFTYFGLSNPAYQEDKIPV